MNTLQTRTLVLSLIFTIFSTSIFSQSTWKHVKTNPADPNSESVIIYLATAEISENRTIAGGALNEDGEEFRQVLTLLDADGKVLIDTLPNKRDYGIIYIQPILNTNTFMTISLKIEELDFIKTVYNYDFKKLSESKIFVTSSFDNDDFVFKQSKLNNGNTVVSGPISGGGIIYFIISPDGTIVKKDIIITEKQNHNILQSFDGKKHYIFGESLIELDSNFNVNSTIIEELPQDQYEYGFSATKFSDLYVVYNMFYEGGPAITTYDYDFNVVNEIYAPEDSIDYLYAGPPFNSMVAKDSFLFTGFTKYDDEFENGRMYIRKYDTKFKLVSETILTDSLYQFSIINIASASDCGIYMTAFGELNVPNNSTVSTAVYKLDCDGRLSSTSNQKHNLVGHTVYPNPSTGQFNISLHNIDGDVEIEFYDMAGKNILKKSIQSATLNSLDLSSLNTGLYSYRVTKTGKLLSAGKWIKN